MVRALLAALLPTLFALSLLAAPAAAQDVFQEGTTVSVELMNGDKLTGILIDAQGPELVIEHDIFGRMQIPRAAIKPMTVEAPASLEAVSPWSGKADLSLSGSGGNTQNQNFRVGAEAKHDDAEGTDLITTWFLHTTAEHETTQAKSFTQYRHEWKLDDSKYRPFVQGSYETDQFTDYYSRTAAAAGFAYPCLVGDVHNVTGRAGLGISYKAGEDDPDIETTNYEALIGLDWLWAVSQTSNFSFGSDMYPSINNSGEFRTVSHAAYEIKVDPDSAWFVKLGFDHMYDSDPGTDSDKSDYNYFVGLGRSF